MRTRTRVRQRNINHLQKQAKLVEEAGYWMDPEEDDMNAFLHMMDAEIKNISLFAWLEESLLQK